MGRGIFTGLIWGTIVGFGILVVANEVAAPVKLTASQTAPAVSGGVTPPVESAPVDAADVADTEAAPAEVDPAEPKASEGETLPAEPVASEGNIEPESESGTTPTEIAPAETAPSEATPQTEAQTEAHVPEATTEPSAAPEIVLPNGPQTPQGGDEAMDSVETPETSPVLTPPQGFAPQAGAADSQPAAPDGVDLPGATPSAPEGTSMEEGMDDTTTDSDTDTDETLNTMPEVKIMSPEDAATEALPGQKVGSFTDRNDSRVSSRLPSITDAPATDTAEAAPMVVADDLPALLAYSADFNETPSGPVMSVILVDIAQLGPEDAALSHLPFPVTFAVDAMASQAGERALAYRDKGMEVLSMISLPDGATPQDAAVIMSEAANLVPVSIGFLDVPSASFQASRQVAAQVVASAQESGRGLVTFPHGLNSLEQEAKRAKAPAALVFRDFDGRSQDVAAMKRFLDQAAFQAGTGKTVVLLGRSKPDTIQALAEWSLGNRAATVTMVPLSYLLSRSQL
ncbi:divergent polysaccharide deacetylase family protein [Celeribacter sp.]|uniref:divergent polysaccharide deacetylase family protein n=1 Tax=Celeribacter sp. TaxID=1890673 RepID=UPI003A93574B